VFFYTKADLHDPNLCAFASLREIFFLLLLRFLRILAAIHLLA